MRKIVVIGFLIIILIIFSLITLVGSANKKKMQLGVAATPVLNSPSNIPYKPLIPGLTEVFSETHNRITTLPAGRIRKIMVTGDIIPARSVNNSVVVRNDPVWPYASVSSILKNIQRDITLVNLETPLISGCKATIEGMVFCGEKRNVVGLKSIDTTIASLANNHAGNHGIEGVMETKTLLEQNGIDVIGVNGGLVKDIRGLRFAFLSYNDVTAPQPGIANVNEDKIKKDITNAKSNADIVILLFHWGVEYRSQPDERQIYLAHFAVDNGADLVLGNHPHWIQPVEIYKNKFIVYAHGNFVFDQMWSEKTREGVLGLYTFYDNQLVDIQFIPHKIYDYGQPRLLEGEERRRILDEMLAESRILSNQK